MKFFKTLSQRCHRNASQPNSPTRVTPCRVESKFVIATVSALFLLVPPMDCRTFAAELFPSKEVGLSWTQFRAAGYSEPVCGVAYGLKDEVTSGMPLGGIDTGCLDLQTDGSFGLSTIFNTHVPNRGGDRIRKPFLALAVDGRTWALAGLPKSSALRHTVPWHPDCMGTNQPGWVELPTPGWPDGTSYPGWAKSTGKSPFDLPAGRVAALTPTILRWTSPIRGEIQVSGGIWQVRNSGQAQTWALRKTYADPMAEGKLSWGPTSASPQPFRRGSQGEVPLRLSVQKGDWIELRLEQAAGKGRDYVGVDLKIAAIDGSQTWDLATDWSDVQNPNGAWTYAPFRRHMCLERLPSVEYAREIRYWGHYPVADMEFETSAPVQVGLRAWTPFIPGAVKDSMIPGAVFEVRLRNTRAEETKGTLLFNFSGPTPEEADNHQFHHESLDGDVRGVHVKGGPVAYALGVLGKESIRRGGDLGEEQETWTRFAQSLPAPHGNQSGASVAVDFALGARQEKVVRFLLTWSAPEWKAGGHPAAKENRTFTHMYAKHYPDPVATAQLLAARHESLLHRIVAWQQVIYTEQQLPIWLRDSLVNSLHLITEAGLWAQAKSPLGAWCRPEDGLFGMSECPRQCPQIECIPCSFYGNIPLVYFFPELALSTLRGYKNYQFPDGAVPWAFGGMAEFARPHRGHQVSSSDVCLVEMIDKLWLRTGDDGVLREFYDAAKRTTIHTMNLRPEYGDKQVIAMPSGDKDQEWLESIRLFGMVSHVGGIHLAQLRMVRRMAEKMGDVDFVKQCDAWLDAGSKAMEEEMWTGTHYLLYNEFQSGKKSDVVLSCLLDGEWIARFHGLPGVFRPDRVKTTLSTIAKVSGDAKHSPYGLRLFSNTNGSPARGSKVDANGRPAEGNFSLWTGTLFSPEGFMLGMTYIYNGQQEFGEDIMRRMMTYVVQKGYTWEFPIVWDPATGRHTFGSDYYQNMIMWSVPAVIAGSQDLAGPCKPGGLVQRILAAGESK